MTFSRDCRAISGKSQQTFAPKKNTNIHNEKNRVQTSGHELRCLSKMQIQKDQQREAEASASDTIEKKKHAKFMQKFMATCWVENMTKAKSCSDQSHHSVLVTSVSPKCSWRGKLHKNLRGLDHWIGRSLGDRSPQNWMTRNRKARASTACAAATTTSEPLEIGWAWNPVAHIKAH